MVAAQARSSRLAVNRLNRRIAAYSLEQRIALTRATTKLTRQLAKDKLSAAKARTKIRMMAKARRMQQAAARARSRKEFATSLNSVANTVTAQARSHAKSLGRITGTVVKYAKASKAARARLRTNMRVMRNDMNRKIVRAIQLGQIRMKAVARAAAKALKKTTSTVRGHLQSKIQKMSDNVFNLIQGNQQKLADNYLSAKAYCVAAKWKFRAYNKKSRQNPLVSIGDWCNTVAALSNVKISKSPGIGMGLKTIPTLFSGKKIKVVKGAVSKINGLVAEYMRTIKQVTARWGLGIGKYLIKKIAASYAFEGGPPSGIERQELGQEGYRRVPQWAQDWTQQSPEHFRALAVNMKTFSATLSELTKRLSKIAVKSAAAKPVEVKPPEWNGN